MNQIYRDLHVLRDKIDWAKGAGGGAAVIPTARPEHHIRHFGALTRLLFLPAERGESPPGEDGVPPGSLLQRRR